jgi:hypothetical protein
VNSSDPDDRIFETLLSEAVGGSTPPDLSDRIIAALNAPVVPPPIARFEALVETRETSRPPGVRNVGSGKGRELATQDSEDLGPSSRRRNRRLGWLAIAISIAATVVFIGRQTGWNEAEPARITAKPPNSVAIAAERNAAGSSTNPDVTNPAPATDVAQDPAVGGDAGAVVSDVAPRPIELERPDFQPLSGPQFESIAGGASNGLRQPAFPKPPAPMNDDQIRQRIDRGLASAWEASSVAATEEVDGETLRRRLSELFGGEFSDDSESPGQFIARTMQTPETQQRLAARFAASLLGRPGSKRISPAQFDVFVTYLRPALDGSRSFDALAGEMLMARGGVDPSDSDFEPAAVWLGALAGPQSVPMAEQVGHALLDVDLRCGRCHDHPLDARVWQGQYWQFSAMFETGLRWTVDDEGMLRVDSTRQATDRDVVFYEQADGRQRAASPRAIDAWILGNVALPSDIDANATSGANEIERMAIAMNDNPQLAGAIVNRVWEAVYGRPLVGSVADPTSMPESDALIRLQQDLAAQFRAHRFNLGKLFTWVAQAKPMRLATPAEWQSPRFESATAADLRRAATQVQHFAGYPAAIQRRGTGELLAMVGVGQQQGPAGIDLGQFPRGLLGQLQPQEDRFPSESTAARKSIAIDPTQLLRASLETVDTPEPPATASDANVTSGAAGLPAPWLQRVAGVDPYQRRAEHLYYLAGYWNPSGQQMEVARRLRDISDDEAQALRRLWWVLSHETL